MNDFQAAKATGQGLIESIDNLVPGLLPGLPGMSHIDLEDSLPNLSRGKAIALRAHPGAELLQGKTTLRTLAHGRDSKLKTSN